VLVSSISIKPKKDKNNTIRFAGVMTDSKAQASIKINPFM